MSGQKSVQPWAVAVLIPQKGPRFPLSMCFGEIQSRSGTLWRKDEEDLEPSGNRKIIRWTSADNAVSVPTGLSGVHGRTEFPMPISSPLDTKQINSVTGFLHFCHAAYMKWPEPNGSFPKLSVSVLGSKTTEARRTLKWRHIKFTVLDRLLLPDQIKGEAFHTGMKMGVLFETCRKIRSSFRWGKE